MTVTLIAYHEHEARSIARHFELPVRHLLLKTHAMAGQALDHGVYYLRDHTTPERLCLTTRRAHRTWPQAHIQWRYTDVDAFITQVEPSMRRWKAQQIRLAQAWIGRFPDLTLRITAQGYRIALRTDHPPGESARWEAEWPLTDDAWVALHRLHAQVRQALQDGWFFCAHCQTARPLSELGDGDGAERRCQACATAETRS